MNEYKVDVPVTIIFFNRAEPLKAVFESVKNARPSKLFLVQDGPRSNNSKDEKEVQKCREVVSNIDWQCAVYRNYSDENLGCGERVASGLSWVFEYVDRTIILEDDCVASPSFYPFCEEILEKYKNDTRISQICGMNHLGVYPNTTDSYFFSSTGSCWGWATWKSKWEQMEYDMPYITDEKTMEVFKHNLYMKKHNNGRKYIKQGIKKKQQLSHGEKLSAWTYQFNMSKYLNSQFNIIPKYNMINNIGVTDDSTHTSNSLNCLPSGIKDVYFMKVYEVDFPLINPKYVIVDDRYEKSVEKMMGTFGLRKVIKGIEARLRNLLFCRK